MSNSAVVHKPVALVTGAAGGIGRAVAVRLGREGYLVGLVDINSAGLTELLACIGSEHFTFTCDITDHNALEKVVEDLFAKTGRIDLLVNNAGTVLFKPFADCRIEELKHENTLNYMAALYCIKAVLPHMLEAGQGTIISISSLGAILPMATSPNYTASKAALRGLTLALNLSLKEHGIHAGCICPSAVDTKMLHKEALQGGSALNFLQDPLSPDRVAAAVWKAIMKKKIEICIPAGEGYSSKLGGVFPSLLPKVLPRLEKIGEKNRIKFIRKKNLNDS